MKTQPKMKQKFNMTFVLKNNGSGGSESQISQAKSDFEYLALAFLISRERKGLARKFVFRYFFFFCGLELSLKKYLFLQK